MTLFRIKYKNLEASAVVDPNQPYSASFHYECEGKQRTFKATYHKGHHRCKFTVSRTCTSLFVTRRRSNKLAPIMTSMLQQNGYKLPDNTHRTHVAVASQVSRKPQQTVLNLQLAGLVF